MTSSLRFIALTLALLFAAARLPAAFYPKQDEFRRYLRAFSKTSEGSPKQSRTLSALLTLSSTSAAVEFLYGNSELRKIQAPAKTASEMIRGLVIEEADPAKKSALLNLLGILQSISPDCRSSSATSALSRSLECPAAAFRDATEVESGALRLAFLNLADVLLSFGENQQAKDALEQLDLTDFGEYELQARESLCWASANPIGVPRLRRGQYLERVEGSVPTYTGSASGAGVRGVVILDALVNARGEVVCIRLIKGLSHGLSAATIQAAKRWRFERPVSKTQKFSIMTFTIRFGVK